MEVIDIPIRQLVEATWNPNQMDDGMLSRLRESLRRYGVVENLVVRPLDDGSYEVLSGNQRLRLLREMGYETVPCVVMKLDNSQARLLAQILNHVHGEDDPGLRADLLREVVERVSEEGALELLPETAMSFKALVEMGKETLAEHLEAWEKVQSARLRHLTFQLTPDQLEVVEEALDKVFDLCGPPDDTNGNPNRRGYALYLLCRRFLEMWEAYTRMRIRQVEGDE